jgi:hypothetical protein
MYEEVAKVAITDEDLALAARTAAAQVVDPAHEPKECKYCTQGELNRLDAEEQASGRPRELMADFKEFSRDTWIALIDDVVEQTSTTRLEQ